MSDEKLTVAELLARRNKERGDSAGSEDRPRRRRRSLEEGGVSVAELTGSIPRVEADGPRRGAHAAVEDDEQIEDRAVEAPEVAEVPEAAEPAVPDEDGSAEAEYADELAAAEELEDEPVAADEPVEEPSEPVEPREPFSVPSAVPVDPRPVMANDETGEITFTFTKFHDARTASEPVAEVGPMAREVLEGSNAYDDRPTNILPVVDEDATADETPDDAPESLEPVETGQLTREPDTSDDRVFDGSAIAGGTFAAGSGAMADHVDDMPAAYREHEHDVADLDVPEHAVGAGTFGHPDHEDAEAARAFDGSSLIDDAGYGTGYDAEPMADEERRRDFVDFSGKPDTTETVDPFDDPAPATAAVPAVDEPAAKATEKDRGDYVEDNSLSIGLLIAQTIVGLLFGGLIFALFMMLWMVLPTAVVAVIAVAFAFGLVVVVNLIRRERDRLTPVLAGIVGLVVSFAPYVLTMM